MGGVSAGPGTRPQARPGVGGHEGVRVRETDPIADRDARWAHIPHVGEVWAEAFANIIRVADGASGVHCGR